MKKCCWIFAIVLVVVHAASSPAIAQTTPGNVLSKTFPDDMKLQHASLSRDGRFAILESRLEVLGMNTTDGTIIWRRTAKGKESLKGYCIRWLSEREAVVPTDKGLEWIDVSNGVSKALVPFLPGGLEELRYQGRDEKEITWPVMPRRFGNVLLVPFTDGYQLFDLVNRRELYRSTEKLDDVYMEFWGTSVLVYGDMDTAIVFDMQQPRILAVHPMKDGDLDRTTYKNLFRHQDQIALVTNDDVVCYDGASRKQIGKCGFEPDGIDNYHVLLLKGTLCFLGRKDAELSLYSVGQAKRRWSVNIGAEKSAKLIDAWPLGDGSILAELFDDDYAISLVKLDGNTGAVAWTRRMAITTGSDTPGLRFQKVVTLGLPQSDPRKEPVLQRYAPNDLDSLYRQTYYTQLGIDSSRPHEAWEFVSLINNTFVHQDRYGTGAIRFIGAYGSDLFVQALGKLRRAWDGKESEEEYSAEGIIQLDAQTGTVHQYTPVPFLRQYDRSFMNATKICMPKPVEDGVVINGSHTVVHVHQNGTIDTIGCSVRDGEMLFVEDRGKDYLSYSAEDADDNWIHWRVLLTPTGCKHELMGFSTDCRLIDTFSDSTYAPVTLRYVDDRLEAYPVLTELPKTWPQPRWTISEDQLEELNVNDVRNSNNVQDAAGIFLGSEMVYILGRDGFGIVDVNTGCMNKIKWRGYDEKLSDKYGAQGFVRAYAGGAAYDLGSQVGIAKIGASCEVSELGSIDEHRAFLDVSFAPLANMLMVLNTDTSTVNVYQIK
jgi:hypothetical protein